MKNGLLIENAHYYYNGSFFDGDIVVRGEKIQTIDRHYTGKRDDLEIIDATGYEVLPGLIDSHVHFREPGFEYREDFFTGSRAAAAGGFTTVCEMPNVCPPPSTRERLARKIALLEEKAVIDIALLGAAGFDNRLALQELIDDGVVACKTFLQPIPIGKEEAYLGLTAANDGELYLLLQEAAKTGGRFLFHCENYDLIQEMEKKLHAVGGEQNSFHYLSRPAVAEVESVATLLTFAKATGAKIGIAHLSTGGACELIKQAKKDGVDVLAETCYQYLVFNHRQVDQFGVYAKCNPPLRSQEEMAAMWQYVLDGTIDMLGSDHAPFVAEEKTAGADGKIWQATSGFPGTEAFLPLMLTAVNQGKISLAQLTYLMSESTAKAYKLYPQKGAIIPGTDGDFTIIDLKKEYQLNKELMYTKAKDINVLFDGMKVQGAPVYTICRGKIICSHGVVNEAKGFGKYLVAGK